MIKIDTFLRTLEMGFLNLGAKLLPLLAELSFKTCTLDNIRSSLLRCPVIVFIADTYEIPLQLTFSEKVT